MLNRHRREYILDHISESRRITVTDLVQALHVSDETIRRDLNDLESEGHLRRVHGGAVLIAPIHDQPINEREQQHAKEKGVIARLALEQISDETAIFLDTGTTTLALARQISGFANLKLYTNSLKIAQAASNHHGITVHLTPGRLRKIEQDLVGYDTISYIQQFYFDMAFMGVAAIDQERGVMDYEEDEARIRQSLLKCSRLGVFLADSSKFGKTANVQTASFQDIDQIITERRPHLEFVKCIEQKQVELIHA
jgi:DeoR family transcriptional regulator, glycerol-3-phosphate regulon repressor